MSGHSKWSQIKHKKEATDKKRSALFSKLIHNIRTAAKADPNPEFNPQLRSAILKAKNEGVAQETIDRAVKNASEADELEDVLIEAYGPEGAGIIIEGVTDNTNRTINELKSLFKEYDVKLAPQGSLLWSFEKTETGYKPKFPISVSEPNKEKTSKLINALRERDDISEVYINIS
ncbi:MAG: YebC/PmpR family DNA-binding transcriptional regulator [Patescibacteria group bacterium]|nr:YebC/PmpR family DNA-binding transcriptional regulator [Patescibacteria group bacterium]